MEHVFLGDHHSIQKIRELIAAVADTGFSVLITGETGTGKEVVARLLHQSSPRRNERFLKVNCAALPLTLLESELFGYEKGAFSGAVRLKPGKFELASDGVIFLDEIGDMNPALQAKFLQVLQSGEFTRLGGTRDIKVNAWVIAATNHDLERDIRKGRFREDLYYRINIIRIHIPALRERPEDIPQLADHFIDKLGREMETNKPFDLDPDLLALFAAYHWPGNVRELASVVLRLLLGENPAGLRNELLQGMAADGIAAAAFRSELESLSEHPPRATLEPAAIRPLKEIRREATAQIERKAILQALARSDWNKSSAARMLGISYKALFYKMHDLGIGLQPGQKTDAP